MEDASDVQTAGLVRRPAGRGSGHARGARLRWRAVVAPLAVAAYTVLAAVGAALALGPAVLAGGPVGRRRATPRGALAHAEEREALGG